MAVLEMENNRRHATWLVVAFCAKRHPVPSFDLLSFVYGLTQLSLRPDSIQLEERWLTTSLSAQHRTA